MSDQPYDFVDAVEAHRVASEAQAGCEQAMRDAAEQLAEAEREYRVALAKEIMRQHTAGVAWTVAQDTARGDQTVADLKFVRDVAKGVLGAAEQAAWRHTADRKDTLEFIVWSRLVHGRDAAGEQPRWSPRAAA